MISSLEEYNKTKEELEAFEKECINNSKLKKDAIVRYKGEIGRISYVAFDKEKRVKYLFKPSRLFKTYLFNSSEKYVYDDDEGIEILDHNPFEDFKEEYDEMSKYETVDSKSEASRMERRYFEIQRMCAHLWKYMSRWSGADTYRCEECGKTIEDNENNS